MNLKSHWNDFLADLSRYGLRNRFDWHEPSLINICLYRIARFISSIDCKTLRLVLSMIHLPVFMTATLVTGIHLPRGTVIGPGLRIYHFGSIVINPEVVIGRNCTLRHDVTIGTRTGDHDVPRIGDNVDVGAGAKILGSIRIGNNVTIGANAVVITDVPGDHIAVGVPARILPKAIGKKRS